ncbi:MAG TPA: IclR family transcriptional regulator [Candidatus Dormibacteraeota bacterium]|nr:IclR family transcriptional regulator [Candidatus Dormibacteraeota bacterium]
MPKERRKTALGRPTVQSVDRTLDVLEALATRRSATGISELSHIVGLHVSTVHRLLATLVDRGYVRQDPETARYHLGARIFSLSTAAEVHLDLRLLGRPYLERLMRATSETSNLVTLADEEICYLDQVESNYLVKMFTQPGMRAPLYCTGSGKVCMAFLSEEQRHALLSQRMRPRTVHTLVERDQIEKELAEIRRQGYGFDNEEMEEGVRCVAAPVFDRRGQVIGALSVSGPTTRMTPEKAQSCVPPLLTVARELSAQLGYGQQLVPEAGAPARARIGAAAR